MAEEIVKPESTVTMKWSKLIEIYIAIACGFTAGTFALTNYYLSETKEELQRLKEASDWKLPETLKALKETSDSVRLETAERKELEGLRTERDQLLQRAQQVEAEMKTATARSEALAATVEKCTAAPSTFDLSAHQAKELLKNDLMLATGYIFSDRAEVQVGNDTAELKVGQKREFTAGGRPCTVTLMGIKSGVAEKATFSFLCQSAPPKAGR